MLRASALLLAFATPAWADFPETVSDFILPGYATFASASQALADAAQQSCDPATLRPAYDAAWDAWLGVQHLRFGPAEQDGIGLSIAFWPDPKGSGAKAQRALLLGDPALLEPATFAQQSVAARGLTGLERLLFPKEPLPADPCPLIRATATDLASTAQAINAAWQSGYGQTMLTAGQPGNTTFLTRIEARQMLFTQVVSGLEFIKDQRLARPLGSFDAPHPERAEAVASGRSLANIRAALIAQRAMVETLTPDAPKTIAGYDHAIALAEGLNDPVLAGVATPEGWLKVEILQQAIASLIDTVNAELGPELDVGIGFNAADGD